MNILNPDGKCNLHTHSIYCDGKDTPEAMVQRAIALGFTTLGFSGHEYAPYDTDCCMSPESTLAYQEEVSRLKEAYAGKIRILLGIERDFFGDPDPFPYDYVIGSIHYLKIGSEYLCVEDTPERFEAEVEKLFHGDFRACVENYYETAGRLVTMTGAQILGHFDIVTKFNEGSRYFDEESSWYRNAAIEALHRAVEPCEKPPVLEINTGGMAKGWRSRPYPARFLVEEADRMGLPILLSSDCHDAAKLTYGFEDVLRDLKNQ